MTEPQELIDLDDIPRAELGKHNEAYPAVYEALYAWWWELHPCGPDDQYHRVGTFLDELATRGFRVTPIDAHQE